jgi:two-component system NtrC family sensor kinase
MIPVKISAMIICCFSVLNIYGQDYQKVDSLHNVLKAAKDPKETISVLIRLSWQYPWSRPDTAIYYAWQAFQLSKQHGSIEGEVAATGPLSEALCAKGNFAKALELDLRALALAEQSGNVKLNENILAALAGAYFYAGEYEKALAIDKRLLWHEENRVKKTDRLWVVYGFIGEAYYHLGKTDSAQLYILKASALDKKRKQHWSIPYYYSALIHSKFTNYDSALYYYRKGIPYSGNLTLDLVDGYNGIAAIFKKTNQIDSAIYYARKAIVLAQRESLSPKIIEAASLLAQLFANKNVDTAFFYLRAMVVAKDSLFSQEKVRQLQNLTFNDQLRQQELQQQKNDLKNNQKTFALFSGLSLFLVTSFFLWRNNRHKQKAYTLLQSQKKEIDLQKEKAENALDELKAAQSQLIQSEKMASLGELTAGIAHEIQNPLNFVNNFSEVSNELIEEMKTELATGNQQLVTEIANDIKQNLEKITHHGKRADAIVKGMLQHSKKTSGEKEPTDLNALCEEFLRLSYHGLRAKDKTFNSKFETDFESTLPKINVVPQDIGRVLLNLITNAFYAVNERAKEKIPDYEPAVTVSTKTLSGKIEIKVKDNGNGIPEIIKEKIFQPFFTTKPTGQGTGLGLSLSYDIVKAHGGELKAETKGGEGSEFTVHLNNV